MSETPTRAKREGKAAAATAPCRWTLSDALEAIPQGVELPYARVFAHGSMSLEVYAPVGRDRQRPHKQDELYVVMRGRGAFVNGARRTSFAPGDVLFVPAGVEHRFEAFSPGLAVWVVFWGPEGGEGPAPHPAPEGALAWSVADGLGRIPPDAELRSVPLCVHGTLTLKLYNPKKHDPQKPHTRDELYVIWQGTGTFVLDGRRQRFGPGDVLFVPAGPAHRFEAFGEELVTWVVFYGPEGGEH